MSHYVLIHGAWEEARAWDDVTRELQNFGHRVTALDMPGHGAKSLPLGEVTMEGYVRDIVSYLVELEQPVILVGHSMAGAVISQVAEQVPALVQRLVYVAGFLLPDGESVLAAMQSDTAGEFLPNIVFSDDGSYATVPGAVLLDVGFHDVEANVVDRVLPLMGDRQATEPFQAAVSVSTANFGSVPKTYVRTSRDRVTTPELQDRLISNWPVDTVFHLETGHFPLFSAPRELARVLHDSATPSLAESA